jgi:Holliday junction resolvase-like predicted endonuclease
MTDNSRSKSDAIRIVRQFLENNGAGIIEESYTCEAGSIDLIYREDGEMVFATVDSLSGLVMPDENLTENDRVRMEIAAASYLSSHDCPSARVRFDTLTIAQIGEGKAMLCHHRDAFSTVRESIKRSAEAKRIIGQEGRKATKTRKSKGRER